MPEALVGVRHPGLRVVESQVSHFLGRETRASAAAPGMARWRERLFALMSRNAQSAMAFFKLPPERVFELGVQVEL